MKKWSKLDIPDLSGKVIIVTGGNSGLGYESVKAFALNSAEVIMACRSVEKGKLAKEKILEIKSDSKIEVMQLDLADMSSIRDFASSFLSAYNRLDILLNNAGIMMTPYQTTKDGIESQMGTNHLGHFLLTFLLNDILSSTKTSRVVNVSSLAHYACRIDESDMFFLAPSSYSPTKAYSRSKLANLLFTYGLQRYFNERDLSVISLAAHPGVSFTNLGSHVSKNLLLRQLWPITKFLFHSPSHAVMPQLRACLDENAQSGDFFGPGGFMQITGKPVKQKSSRKSYNTKYSDMLWKESEKICGIRF